MDSKLFPEAVYVDGKVVVMYYQPIPKYLRVGATEYVFDCQHGVSLAFVSEAEVQPMLDFLGGCCDHKRHVISLATPVLYSHWLDGRGGR